MKLYNLLQAYDFDELMPVINEMFPGTSKFRPQLKTAYDMMVNIKPVSSKKVIRYKMMKAQEGNLHYIGADDTSFTATWDVVLGKEVSREPGVDLTNEELLANCFVNLCLIGKYPPEFEKDHQILMK